MSWVARGSHQSNANANGNANCNGNGNGNGKFSNANRNGKTNSSPWRQKIAQQRKSLPIASVEKRLIEEVRKNDILIIVGETGSGKTTR
ncbi:ATP-dependent RNA helicase dhx8-like protein, partial [Trifolium pratense]